jgi:hypothetical protein
MTIFPDILGKRKLLAIVFFGFRVHPAFGIREMLISQIPVSFAPAAKADIVILTLTALPFDGEILEMEPFAVRFMDIYQTFFIDITGREMGQEVAGQDITPIGNIDLYLAMDHIAV